MRKILFAKVLHESILWYGAFRVKFFHMNLWNVSSPKYQVLILQYALYSIISPAFKDWAVKYLDTA